ncbi:MAG: heme peroxidase family protein [Thermoplasmata archaeon]|nr:heme peroxidase family protein [Thermoplasmata archaeon]
MGSMHPHLFHGTELRGLTSLARSSLPDGRFGRMFRNLAPFLPRNDLLEALARQMIEPEPKPGQDDTAGDNPDIPAGFTYFGQFIDHDLTFDPVSQLQRDNDPDALRDFRTPRFDLDSIYGSGPADQPFLYEDDGIHLLIGRNAAGEEDLPRNAKGRALLGDPRNDENLIVSQLALGILKFHNRVVDTPAVAGLSDTVRFDEARRLVRWHYQWAVIQDFLVRLVGNDVVDDILRPDTYKVPAGPTAKPVKTVQIVRKFFHWKTRPFMPVEFAVAAYRFGHSMVRGEYELNANVVDIPIFAKDPEPDLRGFRERPAGHVIEWGRFFKFSESKLDVQPSRKIDTKLAFGLSILPDNVAAGIHSLAERDLKRGKALGLPSGQSVARAMAIPEDLILHERDLDPLPRDLLKAFGHHTPLFFYVLKEAEVIGKARRLGPVGGRIVAEVIIGLLQGDPFSYVRAQPAWQPKAGEFGAPRDGEFTVADLLRFARVTIG